MHRFIPPAKGEKSSRNTSRSNQAGIEFPSLITIFSAPNYCGTYDNKGAYFLLDNGMVRLKTFNDTHPPYDLPFGLNALSWSVPFMASHVLQMETYFIKQALGNRKKQRQLKLNSGIPLGSSDEDLVDDEEELKQEEESKVKETVAGVLEDFKEQQVKLA